jgi:site-specific recombinase XerC
MSPVRLLLQGRQPITALDIDYRDFLLDREAARCTPKIMTHYTHAAGNFVAWLEAQAINGLLEITGHHTRAYFVDLQRRGLKETTQHAHGRGIKTCLNWLVNEGELEVSPCPRS